MFSILNPFKKQQKPVKEPVKQEIKKQILNSLRRICQICNTYSVQRVVFGQQVTPKITCKKCELKALGNDPSKLANNLMTIDAFAENLSKQVTEYYHNKMKPNNLYKINVENCNQTIKSSNNQINLIKQSYKNMKNKVNEKMTSIITNTDKINKIPIFQKISDLTANKKLETIGNGQILVNQTIVTDSLHFYDQDSLANQNKKIEDKINKIEEISMIQIDEISDLIKYINKVSV